MGTVELAIRAARRVGEQKCWRAEQALVMIATGDQARADRSAKCTRSELDELGAAFDCAVNTLWQAARLYHPGVQECPQRGVPVFGSSWGQERLRARQLDPEALRGLQLLFAGDEIVLGLNRHPVWANLHFLRSDVLALSERVRNDARAQARRNLVAAARLKRKAWLSFRDAVRVTMINMVKGRQRHLAALCTRDGAPTGQPPAWLIYVLGAAEAADQKARCASLWGRAEKHLLNELSWGRISARGEIEGVSSEIPANEWTCQDRLNLLENSLGVRENITIHLVQHYQSPPEQDTFVSVPNRTQKSPNRGRPKKYKDDLKEHLQDIGRKHKMRSDYQNEEKLSNSKIVEHLRNYCTHQRLKCPGRTKLYEWVREIR
ncbi:hypothetical protein FHT36_001901 [Xanthobacter sp. SG618]|uniref:hypothetical protein n=1 Tax=Xanthobacter sp. SG618 TaxID=2587121 RepID=UPI00145E68D7|nr:hypothetical protein [Xanthobacter sp. SG618]NMN57999.1 hypothetical protein [Xanthobacter sp. SG618]